MSLRASDLIYPVFVKEGLSKKEAIASMPGQYRYGLKSLGGLYPRLSACGIRNVLLFGIPKVKDDEASSARSDDGIVQAAIRRLKGESFTVFADVCLCQYTPHGECRIISDGIADEGESKAALADIAASYARAGADYVAPSAVLDGQVTAIRNALNAHGFSSVKIMSYSAKFASSFYAPFRDAVESSYAGGLRLYQLKVEDREAALSRIEAEVSEGADAVIVKPAMPYLDVVAYAKKRVSVPVAAYQVSGEYVSLRALGDPAVFHESLASIKRAGADYIISYAALDVSEYLK